MHENFECSFRLQKWFDLEVLSVDRGFGFCCPEPLFFICSDVFVIVNICGSTGSWGLS